jgi:hypothetical protein
MGSKGQRYLSKETTDKIDNALNAANVVYFNLATKRKEVLDSLAALEDIVVDYQDVMYELNKHKRLYLGMVKKYKQLKEKY